MDSGAGGRCCPEAGKDPEAVEAAEARGPERPWPAGAEGGALSGARPRGSSPCPARGGRGGGCWNTKWGLQAGTLASRSTTRNRERGGGTEPDPNPGVAHSGAPWSGWDETPGAREMEMVLGKRAALSLVGGCPRMKLARNLIPNTHTHTHLLGD